MLVYVSSETPLHQSCIKKSQPTPFSRTASIFLMDLKTFPRLSFTTDGAEICCIYIYNWCFGAARLASYVHNTETER